MEREVYQQHVIAERIISRRVQKQSTPPQIEQNDPNVESPTERVDYMIKWKGLPYSEATWEEASLCEPRFNTKIEQFKVRERNQKCPSGNNSYQKRPKFQKYQTQPSWIPEGLQLR